MTPEAQRIAIAEACGWKWVTTGPLYSPWVDPGNKEQYPHPPDYLNDLNAMHAAGLSLNPEQRKAYGWCLRGLVMNAIGQGTATEFHISHATAAQRAEAFLRTLDKWVETEPYYPYKDE